jgi:hypothetical protein
MKAMQANKYRHLEARRRFARYRCRCIHCQHRSTFRDNPRQMSRTPKCSSCGEQLWRIDWYRTTGREHRKVICRCGAWHFPHRRGSCHLQSEDYARKLGRRAA